MLQQYARRRIILIRIIVVPKDTLDQSVWVLKRKKREVHLPSHQLEGSDLGYRRTKIGFAVEHTEYRNMVKSEHFQETDLAFLSRRP